MQPLAPFIVNLHPETVNGVQASGEERRALAFVARHEWMLSGDFGSKIGLTRIGFRGIRRLTAKKPPMNLKGTRPTLIAVTPELSPGGASSGFVTFALNEPRLKHSSSVNGVLRTETVP